jgi:peptide subunit release factor 1 (eRF1)
MQSEIEATLRNLVFAQPEIKGTTLITYIVPGSIDLWLVSEHLTSEIATAINIKSKHVRHAVHHSLKVLLNSLEDYCYKGKTPDNGLVMLAGALDLKITDQNTIPCYL